MTRPDDRFVNVARDLPASAEAEGRRWNRSVEQQLEHWARVGRSVSFQRSAERQRVDDAPVGKPGPEDPAEKEGVVAHAEISAAIDATTASINFGDVLAAAGVTTVGIDADGRFAIRRPGGDRSTSSNQ